MNQIKRYKVRKAVLLNDLREALEADRAFKAFLQEIDELIKQDKASALTDPVIADNPLASAYVHAVDFLPANA